MNRSQIVIAIAIVIVRSVSMGCFSVDNLSKRTPKASQPRLFTDLVKDEYR